MLFILLLLGIFTNIHSKLFTYTLYQTNDICQHNWRGAICLPSFSLNPTDQPISIQLDRNSSAQCPSQTIVYIRTRQCIYCSRNFHDIHCHRPRLRRMVPVQKEQMHRNQTTVIGVGVLGILVIGSLFTLFLIKRSQAHTNLLELFNQQQNPNSNIQPINHIKVPRTIKSAHVNSSQPIHLTVPKRITTPR